MIPLIAQTRSDIQFIEMLEQNPHWLWDHIDIFMQFFCYGVIALGFVAAFFPASQAMPTWFGTSRSSPDRHFRLDAKPAAATPQGRGLFSRISK